MFSNINSFITRYNSFSVDELELFNSYLKIKKFPKKTILLREGEICNFEAYINKGCIRSYFIDENGHEVILQFGIEDWWVSDIASFHEQKPSKMYIETLEDCELFIISPETKEKMLSAIPKLERVFRLMVQRNLSALQSRFFKTVYTSAKEKYIDFVERYPSIPQRVPQHYIAAYLGISAEFLSKVRTKIYKK